MKSDKIMNLLFSLARGKANFSIPKVRRQVWENAFVWAIGRLLFRSGASWKGIGIIHRAGNILSWIYNCRASWIYIFSISFYQLSVFINSMWNSLQYEDVELSLVIMWRQWVSDCNFSSYIFEGYSRRIFLGYD